LAALALTSVFAQAQAEVAVPVLAGGERVQTRVSSLLEIRDRNLVRQGWDLSCGAAALSTVLTYDFAAAYSEATIAVSILANTDPQRVRARGGFSLLDLKRFAEAVGFKAEGYAGLTLEDLADSGLSVILPVQIRGLDHFVVFRGRVAGRVLIGDPAFGNLTLSERRFAQIWTSGIGFFVESTSEERPSWRPDEAVTLTIPDLGFVYRFGAVIEPVPATRR
jgi:predicted double-glycine peptidase